MVKKLKLGLALGAGGTKGAAHVGVMKVLQEAGIPIDVIAGTSIGSLYGGAFAAGYTTQEMEDGIRTYPRADVIRFFLHRLKIRDNNRLSRYFYDRLAGLSIEKLPTTFCATASDIVEHRSVDDHDRPADRRHRGQHRHPDAGAAGHAPGPLPARRRLLGLRARRRGG